MTEPLLEVTGLKKHFPIHKGLFSRVSGHVYAVDGVSFRLERGERVALDLDRAAILPLSADRGQVALEDEDVHAFFQEPHGEDEAF